MREQGLSFKAAINQAIRAGAARSASGTRRVRLPLRRMGRPRVDLDRALQLVGELEDEETVRKLRARK
jgi:hypothetical protein